MMNFDDSETQRANLAYIKASMRVPLLSREREFELARRWREAGDQTALHELIVAYARLVVAMAARFRHYGLPLGDLIQEGNLGLLQAAQRFEPQRAVRFSTYAAWWIRSQMQDFILRNWSIVRTGTTAAQKSLFFNLRRLRARIDEPNGGGPNGGGLSDASAGKIAATLGVSARDVLDMDARLSGGDLSLNLAPGEDGDGELQDFLVDPEPSPEATTIHAHDEAIRLRWLSEAISELSPRERMVINERRLREDNATLESLGREFGVSKERVRQIEHRALGKLKTSLERRHAEP